MFSAVYVFEEKDSEIFVLLDCGSSLTIANGQINFTNVFTTAGNSVPVICDVGYNLAGGSNIDCQEDGTWSQNVTCEIIGKKDLLIN